MISKRRILTIFREKGGSGGSTRTATELPEADKDFFEGKLVGEPPMIVRIKSRENWFAVTGSELVSCIDGHVARASLGDIKEVAAKRGITQLLEGKLSGGPLELKLADGSLLTVHIDAGKPFIGMLNVLMYIV